jgi:mannose-6-phosphate isomerase
LPPDAAEYFRAERLQPDAGGSVDLEASFSILVAVAGAGILETESGAELALAKGDTVLVPYAAGASNLLGHVTVIRCQPPATAKHA